MQAMTVPQDSPAHTTIALLQSSSLTSVVQQELERRIVQGELDQATS